MQQDNDKDNITGTRKYLTDLFKAKFPFIYIPTYEEIRVVNLISEIANDVKNIKKKRQVFVWCTTEGLKEIEQNGERLISNVNSAIDALNFIESYNKDAILILKDVHPFLAERNQDISFIRRIRDIVAPLQNGHVTKNVVLIAPVLELPVDLQKDITVVDFNLPTLKEILKVLNDLIDAHKGVIDISLNQNEREILCKAAQGLTLQEAENAFVRAMVSAKRLTINELDIIIEEKCQVIKKTGVLEYIKSDLNIEDVGGLENLKNWLQKRNKSWLDKAQKDYNLPAPKGVLITGVPGCGKSLTAKAISSLWKLPLLRLDVGKIYNKWMGNSEENIRKAIQTAEAVAPSILWVDEIEKGFGDSGGEKDSGTSSRIFATFLTWLQEKTKPVFVIATANNIDRIPPEMLRKGRFDEIFFTDLPTQNERKAIFKIHLEKRLKGSISEKFKITDELLNSLAQATESFVGAEIEQIITAALFEAFSEDRELKENDLYKCIANTVPLATTQSENIVKIREWASQRAVAATKQSDRCDYSMLQNQENDSNDAIQKYRGGRNIDF